MPSPSDNLRVLVVDDSSLYRKVVRDVILDLPGVDVVGVARNGRDALEKIESLQPDVMTLDLEMPELDGIGVLQELADRKISITSIMVSALTARGAKATTTALRLGAFDFILKPTTQSLEESIAQLSRDLAPKLKACWTQVRLDRCVTPSSQSPSVAAYVGVETTKEKTPPEIIAIGISTGGPQALSRMLPELPGDLLCPIVLVQHMPALFTASLAKDLDTRCSLAVQEAKEGQRLMPGNVYIAPGGKQMRVVRIGTAGIVKISDDPPEDHCRPSVNFLFRSIAESYGSAALGVILTGMGDDGTKGCRLLKEKGATIYAQDEASCVVYGMPKSVADAGLVDLVAPLDALAQRITNQAAEGALL